MDSESIEDKPGLANSAHRTDWWAIVGLSIILITYAVLGIGLEDVPLYLDPPSLLIVLGIVIGGLLFGHGYKKTKDALYCSICGKVQSEDEAIIVEDVLTLGIRLSVVGGASGTMFGLVRLLCKGVEDPSALTRAAAIAMLSIFYAIILSGAFSIMRS